MATVITSSEPSTFWGSVREALRGSPRDYTTGSINRAIFLLAIPMVLEMLMESLFAVVDVFWVAKLGAASVATVGLVEALMTLVYAVSMGLGLSATAMVARRVGEKDPEGAAIAGVQAIGLGLLAGLVLAIPGYIFAPRLLQMMGASPEVMAVGSGYARISMSGCIVVLLLFLNNAVFRGAGDAAIAMRVLWISNSINLVLDPCLIFGWGPFPEMGVTGAATATLIGRGIGVLYQFYCLRKGGEHIRILARHVRLNAPVMLRLVRVSITGILQFAIPHIAWIALIRTVSLFGSSAVAGYTIGLRIIIFFILPAWGLSSAASTLVGQNLGALQPDRAEKSVWKTGLYNMLLLGTEGVLLVVFADPIIRLFTQDPEIIPLGVSCLRILSLGNVGYAYGMVMLQAFNGAGDTTTPTIVNFFGFLLFEVPLAYAMAVTLGLQSDGVSWAILISESSIAAVGIYLFRRGKWKAQKI